MEIEYNFDMEDWMVFQKNYFLNSKRLKRSKLFSILFLPFVFILVILPDLLNGKIDFLLLSFIGIITILWVLFIPKYFLKKTLSNAKKMIQEGDNSGILGIHQLILNDNYFITKQPEIECKLNWSAVKKIEEIDTYYFLYTTSISAIVIPKKKINAEQLTELDKILKSKI